MKKAYFSQNNFFEELLSAQSTSLKQQSVWLQWKETAEPFDFSWHNIIWGGISEEVLKFVLNASVNWVRTPDLLNLWHYKKSASVLCEVLKNAPFITYFLNAHIHSRIRDSHEDMTQP